VLAYRLARADPGLVVDGPNGGPARRLAGLYLTAGEPMARSCAICGKVSMGGFNPQSSGMNRVRAHRRYQPNLQPLAVVEGGVVTTKLVCTRCRRTASKKAR